MKKAAMWIVSLLIICGLMTGCGGSASKFAGSYKGTVDMTDVYRQDFEDFTGVPSEASCNVEVSLTLAEEDKQQTFTMSADPEVIKQAISDEIDSRAEEVFNAIMESMDVRQEQYPQIVETMDEYDTVEEMQNAVIEEKKAEIEERIDVSEYQKLLNRTGTFEYDKETGVITLLDQSETAGTITVEEGQDGSGRTYTLRAGDLETVLTKEEAEESK